MLWSSHATQNCLEIWIHLAGDGLAVLSATPWVLSSVFLQASRERRGDSVLFTFAVSCMLWSFFLQICAQPSRVKCCRVACRAALLPCQLCMSFVYIWFGRTFHDKNQGLQRLWTGGVPGQGHGKMRSKGEGLQPPSAGCPPDEQRELLPGTLSS